MIKSQSKFLAFCAIIFFVHKIDASSFSDNDLAQNDYGNFGFAFTDSRGFRLRSPFPGGGQALYAGHMSQFGGGLYGGYYPGSPGYPDILNYDQDGIINPPPNNAFNGGPQIPFNNGGGLPIDPDLSSAGFGPIAPPINAPNQPFNSFGTSANAVGGGTIGSGVVNSNNVAFSNPGFGFSSSQTDAHGNSANIFSVASSSQG